MKLNADEVLGLLRMLDSGRLRGAADYLIKSWVAENPDHPLTAKIRDMRRKFP